MEKFNELKEFFLERKKILIIGGVLVILLLIILCNILFKTNQNDVQEIILEENIKEEKEEVSIKTECKVKVDIKGEVKKTGLYELECESRVLDVINLAGGLTKDADTSILNLGKKVKDEMVIIVLSKDEIKNYEKEEEKLKEKIENCNQIINNDACINNEDIYIKENNDNANDNTNTNTSPNKTDNEVIGDTPVNSLISINKASIEELMTLTGIGKTKAESIILYRNQHGGFKTLEELKNVKGIGDSTFEKIKNNITL